MSKTVIAKNAASQVLGRIFITGAGFIAAILVARTFGVVGFGQFTTITSLIAFGYLFVDFGLNASYIKLDKDKKYFTDFLILRLLIGLISAVVLIFPVVTFSLFGIALFSITPQFFVGLIIFSLTILTQAALITFSAVFQMHKKYELQALSLIPGSVVLVGALFWIASSKAPIIAVYISYVIGGLVSAGIAAYLLRHHFSLGRPDKQFVNTLLVKGLPLGILLIFNLLYFRIDTLLLSSIKGAEAVGVYGYGYKFFDFALTIPLFLSNALYPFLLDNQKNVRKGRINEHEFFFIFLTFGLLGGIIGFFLSPVISLFSPGFEDSVKVLQILCLSLPFFSLTSYLQWLLIARNAEKKILWIYISVAVINILLNMYFVPTHSYFAAAVITGICEGIVLVMLLYVLHSTKNLRKVGSKKPSIVG